MEIAKFEELNNRAIAWAKDKGISGFECSGSQLRQLGEEFGELCKAIKLGKLEDIKLEIGDNFVVLVIFCYQYGFNPVDCFSMAVNKIENRRGKKMDNSFVKDEDL